MAMPAKIKTWTPSTNNRIVYSAFLDMHQKLLHACKEFIKGVSGAVVKGSGDNVTGAMDGVDRIGASGEWVRGGNTGVVHSWIVITMGNAGGVDLLLEFVGVSADNDVRIAFSPGGLYVINATNVRFSPTATDEVVVLAGAWGSASTSGDRIWSAEAATDGKAFYFIVARAGAWVTSLIFEEIVSVVVAPATFSPSVVMTAAPGAPAISGWSGVSTVWKARVNGFNVGATVSIEATSAAIPSVITAPLELQETAWPIMALGLWSMTQVGARGKLGNLIDIHAGNISASDGDTYPNSTDRTHIAFGDYVLVWDASAPVMS